MPRLLSLIVLAAATSLSAQTPVRPRPAPAPVAKPAPAPQPGRAPRPALAPLARDWEFDFPDPLDFPDIDELHAEAMRSIDFDRLHGDAMEQGRRAAEEARLKAELHIDNERWNIEEMRERAWDQAQRAMEFNWPVRGALAPIAPLAPLPSTPRAAWMPGDQADTVYRRARELLNSGEYRRAAAAFREVLSRTPNSAYAADALYWQAFALYRIGGTAELRSAVTLLDEQRAKYPGARMQAETEALTVRIRGALASRGDAGAAALIRTAAADSMLRCDREEQSVRVEALSALARSDAQGAVPLLQKTLARKDACSIPLRRTAVFLLGSISRDGSAVTTMTQVARTDPSFEVRASAIEWLARSPGDDALGTLEELARDTSERIQRTAVRALVAHPAPRARTLVRGIVERSETPERLRLEALSAFDRERTTADDVTWMRALYSRTENPRIRSRLVGTLSNVGGPEVDQWLLSLARDQDTDSDTRRGALRRVGRTLAITELAKLYDASAERPIRESVIETLGQRTEAEATDKLLEIVKSGTDPQLRSRAISALTSKKDPRALRLLMEIIDK